MLPGQEFLAPHDPKDRYDSKSDQESPSKAEFTSPNRPEKVKSRWRRWSEAESLGGDKTPQSSAAVRIDFSEQGDMEMTGFSESDETSQPSSVDSYKDKPEKEKSKEKEKQRPPYEDILDNIYLSER